jgi:23S rRNA pseudouridine1911/1915/1917 synthase
MKIRINKAITLFEFLEEQYPDSPRTRIKKLMKSGKIRINDKPVTLHSFKLKPGDVIEISHSGINVANTGINFSVLYDDQFVIVVDKPAGKPTSSTDGSLSIQEIMSEFLKRESRGRYRAWVVHRLDKEVSGVLLFAKTREAMETMKDTWEETEKHYYALVEGIPEKKEGSVRSWLFEDRSQKVHSGPGKEGAKFSVTHYKVTKEFGDHALLDVRTETGRKNQIRVHLSDIGCPIIGDRKYGASEKFKRRVRLHAYSLSFHHPSTAKRITVKSAMPEGFLSLKPKDEKYK